MQMKRVSKWIALLACSLGGAVSDAQTEPTKWELGDVMRLVTVEKIAQEQIDYPEEIVCFWEARQQLAGQLQGVVINPSRIGQMMFHFPVAPDNPLDIAVRTVFENCNKPLDISLRPDGSQMDDPVVPIFRDGPFWSFYTMELAEENDYWGWGTGVSELGGRLGYPIEFVCADETSVYIAISAREPSPWYSDQLHNLNQHWERISDFGDEEHWREDNADGIEACRTR